ncbi:MAG: hypothetical protein ACLFNJ_01520 [Bacteroidales bacterium]
MTIKYNTKSKVEEYFSQKNHLSKQNEKHWNIPVIMVDNYVELGQLTALRFLEWVALNPGGVVALPTGKTPEFFIKWMEYYLENWNKETNNGMLAEIGLDPLKKPDFRSLHFFQLDEFFPMNPEHERSFYHFVQNFYINKFGFDPEKTHLIDTYNLSRSQKKLLNYHNNLDEIFKDDPVNLDLRSEKPSSGIQKLRKKTIELYDEFCRTYEEKIREMGGIGFFLGGIGPDGHIAFNIRGSSHYSPTRLTSINYETQAAAATDLGGIELVKKKAVITMGLETITYNPDTVAIILAAGQTKSKVVADAIEKAPSLQYPGTCLQKLNQSRFFITNSATQALTLSDETIINLHKKNLTHKNIVEDLVISGSNKAGISLNQAMSDEKKINKIKEWQLAGKLVNKNPKEVIEENYNKLVNKIENSLKIPDNKCILHTAPHHDDIELAYFPFLHHLVRSTNNKNYFTYCTSGFTAVTNFYVEDSLEDVLRFLENETMQKHFQIDKLKDPNNGQSDITGYLRGISKQEPEQQKLYKSARISRWLFHQKNLKNFVELTEYIRNILEVLSSVEPGRKSPEIIQQIKSRLREFEAELAWAHFGIEKDQVFHLNLGFYSEDIFPQHPNFEEDVKPLLDLFEKLHPTIITLALDPEGSGPDTHYKTLIALSEAIDLYVKNNPDINLRIWGYRNVWTRFKPSEADKIIPVSLNSFATLHNMFNSCFISQKSASFPSYEIDGTFSELAQKIWVEQHDQITHLIGQDYFYQNPNPLLRRAYGTIYLKDMSYSDFSETIREIKRLLKTKKLMDK